MYEAIRRFLNKFLVGDQTNSDSYYLMRRIFAVGLGGIYFNAFLIFYFQGIGLYGQSGLLPFANIAEQINLGQKSSLENFYDVVSVFVFDHSDNMIQFVGVFGLALSVLLIAGWVSFPVLLALWLLHISVIHFGQIFYSYGWETQLLELTFLSFFLFPFIKPRLNNPDCPPKLISILFMRWMMFRLMLGAGLIKIRGDQCWRDLTCTIFHYETQPNPNPVSWYLHHLPGWFHNAEVLFNHLVELVLPFGLFGPKKIRRATGVIMIIFQVSLIVSGNLSWLNWLTILMAIPCFDDEFLRIIFSYIRLDRFFKKYLNLAPVRPNRITLTTLFLFLIVGIVFSIDPALNLFSDRQMMNTSYTRLHLINSYGAFGSIGKERFEVIISGTDDESPSQSTVWKEYEFKCKPGQIDRRPCIVTPYHYRIDWQIWFSAMRPELSEVWLLRLAIGFLENRMDILDLIDFNPFQNKPPRLIKMDLYQYQFSKPGDSNWWQRKYVKPYMPPISLQSPIIQRYR